MKSENLTLDVSEAAGLGEPTRIAATLHQPGDGNRGAAHLLFAIHGGGYTREYWNPGFADESYSFARYFTDRGHAVLAIDMLGMGQSSRPEPEDRLSREAIAAAHAEALRQVAQDWNGQKSVTGLGHSMGGMMIIEQAAHHQGMDRVAVLGWANEPMVLGDTDVASLQTQIIPSGYLSTPREKMRKLFYADDVPMEIIEKDEARGSTSPATLGRDALTPGIVHTASAKIEVPVLVVQSVVDTSPEPEKETAYFSASARVDLDILQGAAHCQNFASSRMQHWAQIEEWIERTS